MCFHMPEERHAMPHRDLASVVDLLKHVPLLWIQGGSGHDRKLRRGLAGKDNGFTYGIYTSRDG